MKWSNINIIGINEGVEFQGNDIDQIFNKIIEENSPKLKKEMPIET